MSSRSRFRSPVNIPLLLGLSAVLLYWAAPVKTQDSLQVGYSIFAPDPESPAPAAIALFRLANDEGTLISEAGVEAR